MCNDNIDGVCGSTLPYGNIGCGVSTSGETNLDRLLDKNEQFQRKIQYLLKFKMARLLKQLKLHNQYCHALNCKKHLYFHTSILVYISLPEH